MIWKNTQDRYGLLQILLHWVTVAAIAVLIPLGLWMTGLDYYDPWYKRGPDLHRAIGVLLGMLIMVRLLARQLQVQPLPLSTSRREALAARLVHRLLYLLPLLLVASGYLAGTDRKIAARQEVPDRGNVDAVGRQLVERDKVRPPAFLTPLIHERRYKIDPGLHR